LGSTWDNNNRILAIGIGSAVSNSLIVNNGTLVNFGGFVVGSGMGGFNNSAVFTNGGLLSVGALTVGTGGSVSNTLTFTSGSVVTNLTSATIGAAGSSYNTLSVLGTKAFMNGPLNIGSGTNAVGNQVLIDGGSVLSNIGFGASLAIGSASGANGNSLIA